MEYIVYKTTNKVNNKLYIGVHKTINHKIFDKYIGNGLKIGMKIKEPKTPFQYAILKYGYENFNREVLYVFNTADEAYDKEAELVDIEFVKRVDTYNVALGGGGCRLCYPVYQFDSNGNLVQKWDSSEEAMEYFGSTTNSLQTALQFKEKLFGYYWSRSETININEFSKGDPKKTVYKYTKEGKCIAIYPSITEAANIEGIERTVLTTDIKLESLVKEGFYFSTTLYELFVPKKKESLKGKSYYLYTLEGDYIDIFENSKDLLNYFGVKGWNTIYRAIHGQNGVYKNYQIKTEYLGDKIEAKINKSKPKKVYVYSSNNEFIKECDSIQKASKEFNVHLSSLNRVLRGLSHTTNNYIFRFDKI